MADQTFNTGDAVEIVDGDFDGFTGTIISPDDAASADHSCSSLEAEQSGLWVAINIFGRSVALKQLPERLRHA